MTHRLFPASKVAEAVDKALGDLNSRVSRVKAHATFMEVKHDTLVRIRKQVSLLRFSDRADLRRRTEEVDAQVERARMKVRIVTHEVKQETNRLRAIRRLVTWSGGSAPLPDDMVALSVEDHELVAHHLGS